MPRVASQSGARIFEGFELETRSRDADRTTIGEQPFAVRGNKVRHWTSLPHVSMEPEPPVHGVNHSFTPRAEFFESRWRRSDVLVTAPLRALLFAHRLTSSLVMEARRAAACDQLQAISPSTVAGATAVMEP